MYLFRAFKADLYPWDVPYSSKGCQFSVALLQVYIYIGMHALHIMEHCQIVAMGVS